MKRTVESYQGYRFPRDFINFWVWLCDRFGLSFRVIEELLAERGVIVSYETVRKWCPRLGFEYGRKVK